MEYDDAHLIAAARLIAHERMFGFMLSVLKPVLTIEKTDGLIGPMLREGLPRFRGELLTAGLPERDGLRISAAEEQLANEHCRKCMDELAARLTALLDEHGG